MTTTQAAIELAETRKVYLTACEKFMEKTGILVYADKRIHIDDIRGIREFDIVTREITDRKYPVMLSINVNGIEFLFNP